MHQIVPEDPRHSDLGDAERKRIQTNAEFAKRKLSGAAYLGSAI
jgi:hypothetical protein